MIAVIDYKAGNLTSVMKALHALNSRALNADAIVTADPAEVRRAGKIILPGVGHFAATTLLSETGLTEAIRESIERGVPFLGICVGLQWLFDGSTEAPGVPGLGAFQGMCERFQTEEKIPHVGWNSLTIKPDSRLMAGVEQESFAYYTHAYKAPIDSGTVAVTNYGGPFTGAIERDNIMGVQFHPEKSAAVGLRVLSNFVGL